MGPSLQSFELEAWARSRGLSQADTTQLRAVFEERDALRAVVQDYLDWYDRKPERECVNAVVQAMRAATTKAVAP